MSLKQTVCVVFALALVLAFEGLFPTGSIAQKTGTVDLEVTVKGVDKELEAKLEAAGRGLRTDPRLQVSIDLDLEETPLQQVLARIQKATGVTLSVDMNLQGSLCSPTVAVNVPAWEILADMAAIDVLGGSWQKVDGGYRLSGKAKPSESPPPGSAPRPRRPVTRLPARDFQQGFRDGQFDQDVLKSAGPDAEKYVRREAAGLRITLPAAKGPEQGVGVALCQPVRGDCEIEASFTILQTEAPKSGYGSGVILQVIKDGGTPAIASITRTWRPNQGEGFAANYDSKQAGSKPVRKVFASEAKSGKLRLTRQGSLLRFLVAEGNQDSFREIYQVNFGAEDMRTVRLVADTGKANNLLDVRLENFSLRTGVPARALVDSPTSPTSAPESPKAVSSAPASAKTPTATADASPPVATPPQSSSTGWIVWIAACLAVGMLLAFGCLVCGWFWFRNRSLAKSAPVAKPKRSRPA